MQQKNQLLFVVLAFLFFIGYFTVRNRFFPQAKPVVNEIADEPQVKEEAPKKKPDAPAVGKMPERRRVTPDDKLISLGSQTSDSKFHLGVLLDPFGAGVRSVTLNKFPQADDRGRPIGKPLELIPDAANRYEPSFLLYHYDVNEPNDERPQDTLGRVEWKSLGKQDDGTKESVAFEAQVQGVKITKIFSLTKGEYHLGLEVKVEQAPGAKDRKDLKFRYQLTGAHGLPVEGKWYTSTFRNSLIARVQDGSVFRDLQDLRQISVWEGGKEIRRAQDEIIRYAGVVVQYFASVIVVDDQQQTQNFIGRARPTLQTAVSKGKVASISADGTKFVLAVPDRPDETFYFINDEVKQAFFDRYKEGSRLAVTHDTDPAGNSVAVAFGNDEQTQSLWINDITVRVATEPIDLKEPIVHKFLLYNGPVKPSLLSQMTGDAAVEPELVSRYRYDLHLNTLTDYQSQGFFGRVSSTIGWSWLIIACTNLMHWILGGLHSMVPSFGLCIIFLTVLVRLLIFPISRKQAMTSLKMQSLAPELKKLQEKFKDDRQGMGAAQMQLYRKHGINPFGTCWFLLLQMPIMMGLYFALQESILFRLASFWPTWITNLAAPDMLFEWGESIPWISQPQAYGGFFYLGPYFNLLPVIAVTLMVFQQKMLTPPPTDEQQEMQQKIMKYMMVFFGLMFYKVAAGLCVYFIASSVWGFAERKLLPKFKPVVDDTSADSLLKKMAATPSDMDKTTTNGSTSNAVMTTNVKGRKGKKKRQERGGKTGVIAAESENVVSSNPIVRLRKRISDWWQDLLRQAEKKAR